jgi:hypothetical protein
MNHPAARGINRQGVDAAFAVEEACKSQLLLEAQILRAQQQPGAAADKLAEAAAIEERLREACFTQGLREKAFVHGFSAASCWAQAGDFHHAIGLCHELLAQPDLPARLWQRIDAYAKTLDARRAQWYEELVVQEAGPEDA